MANYLTSGWENYAFIVTPPELDLLLADMHMLTINTHVPVGYIESSPAEYLSQYRDIYKKLSSGTQLLGNDFEGAGEIGLASTLEKYTYGKTHTYRGKSYLNPDFEEPCLHLQYFPLFLLSDSKGKINLSTSCSCTQFPHYTTGLQLCFPKNIQYKQGDDYEPLRTTKTLDSYQDFELLRNRIRSITNPLRVAINGQERRPNIRISPAALTDVENFYFFQTNDVTVIRR